jgi:hypothetical protein
MIHPVRRMRQKYEIFKRDHVDDEVRKYFLFHLENIGHQFYI